ncbi:MAG: hypothetical protein ACRDAU_15355 [Clostridium sp.]
MSNKKEMSSNELETLSILKDKIIDIELLLDKIAKSTMIDKIISEISEEIKHVDRSFNRLNKECYLLENKYKNYIMDNFELIKDLNNTNLNNRLLEDRLFNKIPFDLIENIQKKSSKLFLKSEKFESLNAYYNELMIEKALIEKNILKESKQFIKEENLLRVELEIYLETFLENIKIRIIELEESLIENY